MPYVGANAQQLDSWLQAGLAFHRNGELARALEAYRGILDAAPDHAAAQHLMGTALLQLGRAPEAVPWLERASLRRRGDPHVLANLGQAYIVLGRHDDAAKALRKAARMAPGDVQLQLGLGTALALGGKLAEAATLLTRLAARFPDAPLVWFNLGNALRDLRRYDDAIAAYRKAHALEPQNIEPRNAIGSVLHSALRFEEAELEYRACVAAAPEYLVARYNLASVTMDLGRFAEAETECRAIVARAPGDADAHRLLGTALGHQSRLIDALACYERAATLAPGEAQSAQTLGAALMETGHTAAGSRWLAHAAFLAPESASRSQVTAGALLAQGLFNEAWTEYAHRPAALALLDQHRALHPVRVLARDLSGRHVCVLAEQGLGDQLFFLRYAPRVAQRGAHVTVRPARKIESVLARAPGISRVVAESDPVPPADCYLLAGDLPLALSVLPSSPRPGAGASVATVLSELPHRIAVHWPAPAPSLRIEPLPARLEAMRQRLEALGSPPYIALTWRGGTAPEKQQTAAWLLYKAIGLSALAGVLEGVSGTLITVQRKPAAGEIDALAAAIGRPVHDFSALNDDLEDMLALLALVDEYVGVSNTNMHLRAAAGRTARVLVPAPAEWRWMQSGGVSPWFPGYSIYRQSLQGDWTPALGALARDLREAGASTGA